jgi:hypothetical protein
MSRVIEIQGKFTKEAIAAAHKRQRFAVGDVLKSRKDEYFTVSKIYTERRTLDGKSFIPVPAIDLVGHKKGKVFTVYL